MCYMFGLFFHDFVPVLVFPGVQCLCLIDVVTSLFYTGVLLQTADYVLLILAVMLKQKLKQTLIMLINSDN